MGSFKDAISIRLTTVVVEWSIHPPVLWMVFLFQRIASALMGCCNYTISSHAHFRWIQVEIHQFIHILDNQHVTVKHHDAFILNERENSELGPAVDETSITAKIRACRG